LPYFTDQLQRLRKVAKVFADEGLCIPLVTTLSDFVNANISYAEMSDLLMDCLKKYKISGHCSNQTQIILFS
ncbi:MAG: hypothetical protein ACPL7B_04310, partial [Candidatus Poribacteria bacterium]